MRTGARLSGPFRALAQALDVRAASGGGKTVRATLRAPASALVTDLGA
ncbi:hypothetical protein [Streptomyces rimosus]|nr:hypothetical protein [Streptomyces rimosus]